MRRLNITPSFTNRENAALDKYLTEIGRENLLSADEEIELTQAIKKGDRAALEKLVRANLRFVVSVAKQYQRQWLDLPDLINEGNLGLLKAAEKFDETRGFKFISYAVWRIRQSIIQALNETSHIVRLPQNHINATSKINKIFADYEQNYQLPPTTEELAEALNISEEKAREIEWNRSRGNISLDAILRDDGDPLINFITSEDRSDDNLHHEDLRKALYHSLETHLTDREKTILKKYFWMEGPEMSLEQISNELGIGRERTRQIKEKALRKLRENDLKRFLS